MGPLCGHWCDELKKNFLLLMGCLNFFMHCTQKVFAVLCSVVFVLHWCCVEYCVVLCCFVCYSVALL